jgi:tRNA pseudouridine65 synthase
MAHLACPVIGDVRYGDREKDRSLFEKDRDLRRLYLHAEQLSFPHPGLGRVVTFTAPVPADFQKILQLL